jgi:TolB protein
MREHDWPGRRDRLVHGRTMIASALALVVATAGCSTAPSSAPSLRAPSPPATPPTAVHGSGSPVAVDDLAGRLAFSFDTGIWVSKANGAEARQLTADGGFDPSWSPDGAWIAYRVLTERDDGEIWVVRADGSDPHDLVNDQAFSDWGPAWSPDGRSIAFDSNRSGVLAIWVMDADGTNQRRLTSGHGEYPSWSPDGRRIAYAGGAYYDIRIVNADGTDDHAISSSAAYEMAPAWSPDGEWIAYETQADAYPNVGESGMGPDMEIHVMQPDGSGDRRVTSDAVEDYFPTWAPDGSLLAWSRHGQLVVARPDGTGMNTIRPGNFPAWTR